METQNATVAKIKKILLLTAILGVVLVLTFFLETTVNKFQVDPAIKILQVEGNEDNLGVSFNPNADGTDLVKFSTNPDQIPTYFKANTDLTLTAFEDSFITMAKGTEFRTLIFTKKKLHLQLIKGEVILDNRLSQNPVTIQVDNVMIKPYQKGRFYLSKEDSTTLQALQGQALLGIYSSKGKLQQSLLLPRSTAFNFESLATTKTKPNPKAANPNFYLVAQNADILPDIEAKLESKELLNLEYKNRNIDPSNSTNFLPGFTQALTFNNKKRNYLKLYSFAEQLKFAEASLLASNSTQGALGLTEAKRTFQDQTASSPNSLETFKNFLEKTYSYYLALTPEQDLNNIKVYITDNHLNLFDPKYIKLAILSYFEDVFVDYSRGRTSEAESTLDKIAQLINQANLDSTDTAYLLTSLDNILVQHPRSNVAQSYNLRTELAENLEDSDEFEKVSAEHLSRLQTYFEQQEVANSDIQESVAILINQVSAFEKLQYEDFFDEVSKAAL